MQSEIQKLNAAINDRDLKILDLSKKISKQALSINQHERTIAALRSNEQNTLITLHKKNICIADLEDRIESQVSKRIAPILKQCEELKEIIRAQQKELNTYLEDHETYLLFIDEKKDKMAEAELLKDYNEELNGQIKEVEDLNENLLNDKKLLQEELELHNTQGNDLMAQMEYFLQTIS